MAHLNIIKDIIQEAKQISENKDIKTSNFYKENLINLSVYSISQLPYFNNRYHFMRLLFNNNMISITSQKANDLPLLINKMGNINSDYGFDNFYNQYFNSSDKRIHNMLYKNSDIKLLKEYKDILENSNNFFEFVDKIKEKDEQDDNFIVGIKRLKEEGFSKDLFDIGIHFLPAKPEEQINKKLINYERNNPIDMFLLRDNFSLDIYSNIKSSKKEILKNIVSKEDNDLKINTNSSANKLQKLLNSNEIIIDNEENIKNTLKKIEKLIHNDHPLLKKTPFHILMTEKDPITRVKKMIDAKLFDIKKKIEMNNINKMLNKEINEEHIIDFYREDIEKIIEKITYDYPELKTNITQIKEFETLEKSIDEESLKPFENFPQNWALNVYWDENESLKGISYMQEEFINKNYEKNKTIIAIKNTIENVGYITLYTSGNKMEIHSITPSSDLVNSDNFIEATNKTLKEYIQRNKIKLVQLDNNLLPQNLEDVIKKEKVNLYFKNLDVYIVGNLLKRFTREDIHQNIVNKEVEDLFHNRLFDNKFFRNLSDNQIKKLKKLEGNYENINDNEMPFHQSIEFRKKIKDEITEIILEEKKENKIKYVK